MKVGTILRAIIRHSDIHICLAMIFAFSWFLHYVAFMRMEMCDRQFKLMNDETMRAMALIDLIAVNYWWAIAYAILTFAAVVFLQIRVRPPWTWWLTAATFCAPCIVYWSACAYSWQTTITTATSMMLVLLGVGHHELALVDAF